MLCALQLFHQRMDFDELFQSPALPRKPSVKPFVVREVIQYSVILQLKKFVDDSGVKRAAEMSVKIRV